MLYLVLTNVQTTLFCKRAPKGTVCFNLAIHRWSAGFLGNSWLIDANALWSTIKLAGGHRARGASLFRTNSPTENGVSAERSAIALSALMRDVCGVSAASASDDVRGDGATNSDALRHVFGSVPSDALSAGSTPDSSGVSAAT